MIVTSYHVWIRIGIEARSMPCFNSWNWGDDWAGRVSSLAVDATRAGGRAGWETEAQLMIERNRKLIQLRARLLMALLRNRNTWNWLLGTNNKKKTNKRSWADRKKEKKVWRWKFKKKKEKKCIVKKRERREGWNDLGWWSVASGKMDTRTRQISPHTVAIPTSSSFLVVAASIDKNEPKRIQVSKEENMLREKKRWP